MAICHTITYFVMGVIASKIFNYAAIFSKANTGFRHLDNPLVMLGVDFQPIRGLLFASVFYPISKAVFGRKYDWLLMGWTLVGLGILGTFAAPAGSLEGIIFTTAPILIQLRGYTEIVTQAMLLSVLLCWWLKHPEKKWANWLLGAVFAISMVLPVLALQAKRG